MKTRTLTLPCSSCKRSRTECRTVDNPYMSCCTACAMNDGDLHRPVPPKVCQATHYFPKMAGCRAATVQCQKSYGHKGAHEGEQGTTAYCWRD